MRVSVTFQQRGLIGCLQEGERSERISTPCYEKDLFLSLIKANKIGDYRKYVLTFKLVEGLH